MRIFFYYLLFFLLPFLCKAQNKNLISNSSFEFNNINSFSLNDTDVNNGCWFKANQNATSIFKYENKTNHNILFPHTGTNVLQFFINAPIYNFINNVLIDTTLSNSRNYVQTKLLQPLIAGKQYYFTMYVGNIKVNAFQNGWDNAFIPNIGVHFSKAKINEFNNANKLNLVPQLNFTSWNITQLDTFTYTKLSGMYTATGGEEYLTLGNFDFYTNFVMNYVSPFYMLSNGNSAISYSHLYVDDVQLVEDTLSTIINNALFGLGKDTAICNNSNIVLGGEPNFSSYLWNTGDTSRFISISVGGVYSCTVDYGCGLFTDSINISILQPPLNFSLGNDTTICEGQFITLSAPSNFNYSWNTSEISKEISISTAGNYNCVISNNCGTKSASILIKTKQKPIIQKLISGNLDICSSGNIISTSLITTSNNNLLWSTGNITNSIITNKPDMYWLKEYNECGENIDTVYVNGCYGLVDFPNAFSPNGDSKNDIFNPILQDKYKIESYNLKVYNRFGNLVFYSNNVDNGWDGMNCEIGNYFYLCTYKEQNSKLTSIKGDVTLVK
jgi:gliding motility-associated-like protein